MCKWGLGSQKHHEPWQLRRDPSGICQNSAHCSRFNMQRLPSLCLFLNDPSSKCMGDLIDTEDEGDNRSLAYGTLLGVLW